MSNFFRPIRWLCTVIGSVVLTLMILSSFDIGNFRMCYGTAEKCRLISEGKTS